MKYFSLIHLLGFWSGSAQSIQAATFFGSKSTFELQFFNSDKYA